LVCETVNDYDVASIDINVFFDDGVLELIIDDSETPFDVLKASVAVGLDVDDLLSKDRTPHNLILCEGNDYDIKCPEGETIEITHANYGRTDGTTCPHSSIKTYDCTDPGHTAILQGECDGKNLCRVWSRNSFWGDTCFGTYKYLEVDYNCVGTGSHHPDPHEFPCHAYFDPAPPSIHSLNCSLPEDVDRDFCGDLVVAVHMVTLQGKESWCPGEEFPYYSDATYTLVPICGCDDHYA
jgi:hypothetical protein